MRAGVYLLGIGTAVAGILDLIWGEFEAAHQPIQALGDHIPGQQTLAYIAAVWLIAAGASLLWRRTERWGAAATALIYLVFAMFYVPRLYSAPHALGVHFAVFAGVLVGMCQQLILVAGAAIVWRAESASFSRWLIGLSSLDFGLAHLTSVQGVAPMVPKWMPLGGNFWSAFTGIAFVFAGLAILVRVWDLPAARLLTLMLLIFSVVALAPLIVAYPHAHVPWGSNAYNLAAVGACWIFAQSIARHDRR